MSEVINCLRCKNPVQPGVDTCPHCGETITEFQRTYASRLIDGKYQIIERLGIGGMGEIFKVVHIHLSEQRVIKIMRATIATDDEAMQRFLHEARLATMIKHRDLAMLYDFATLEDGSYYMVWEFIDGTNIQRWVAKNGPMPPRVALEVAIQSLQGLQALHQMGVIHRDISPENIMITLDHQEKLLCKVIDFGIAKQLSDEGTGQGLTQTGMFLGKLKYASPEQAGFLKEGETLDARSDLYSFGIVLYEMLAGRAPFLSTNPQSYILKHATEKPEPISKINPAVNIPKSLEDVVLKSLEKDRDNRQKDAQEYINELIALRDLIAPDEKYGVGDSMVTLADQKTIQDVIAQATQQATQAGRTVAGQPRTQPSPMGGGDATVVEHLAGGPATQATVVERLGGSEPTMITRSDVATPTMATAVGNEAAPTVVERKMSPPTGGSAATVSDRFAAPEKKSKAPLAIGAVVVVVLLVVGGWYATRKLAEPTIPPEVPTTTPAGINAGAGQGILLTSTPYGALEDIVNADTDEKVDLSNLTDKTIPLRLPLAAGRYKLTLSDPDGRLDNRIATVQGGQFEIVHVEFQRPDIDKLVDDILERQ